MGKFGHRFEKTGNKMQFVFYPNNNHNKSGYIGKSQNYNSLLECQKAMGYFRKFVNDKNIKSLENAYIRVADTGAVEYIENNKTIFKTRPYGESTTRKKGIESIYKNISEYIANNLD